MACGHLSFPDCVHLPSFFKPLFKSYFLHLINMCMFSNNPSMYLVTQSYPTLCGPMDYSPPDSSVHGDSPGKNTGVGRHALLPRDLPNPENEPRSPTLQAGSLPSEPPGKP